MAATRAALAKTARGAKAPCAAVDAIEAALTRATSMRVAGALSCSPTASPRLSRARSSTSSSPSARAAKVRTCPRRRWSPRIKRAAVVGAGTMGGGIAMTYANAGIPVLLKDVDDAARRARRCDHP